MRLGREWTTALVLISSLLNTQPCRSGEIATVDKILEGSNQHVDESEHVKLKRGIDLVWRPVRVKSVLQAHDWLRVGEPAIVGVKLRSDTHGADMTVGDKFRTIPDLIPRGAQSTFEYDAGQVRLVEGSLAMHWLEKSIGVVVDGLTNAISPGSPVRMAFNATPDSGIVFVQSGHVRFPQYPDIALAEGEGARWKTGGSPEKFLISPALMSDLKHSITTTGKTIWPTAFWKRPIFIIPAVVVTTGAVLVITHQSEVTGSVTVIPG